MIICLCNTLTEEQTIEAIKANCNTCAEIIEYFNKTYDCAICCKKICQMINEINSELHTKKERRDS